MAQPRQLHKHFILVILQIPTKLISDNIITLKDLSYNL